MENREKEIGRFALGIFLSEEPINKLNLRIINKNFNIPMGVLISQLKLFTRMLEDNYYPTFKEGVTTVNFGSEE